MVNYPFNSILCNGREIALGDILSKSVSPRSTFETSLFSFTRQWFDESESFVQNTSGSTGTPKPIVITRGQMMASARLTVSALHLQRGNTALVCLDPEYIAGKMMLVRSFVTGMKIIAINPSGNPFPEIPASIQIDFAALVPLQLYETLKSKEAWRLRSTGNIIIGGAAISYETKAFLSKTTGNVFATYGMTETISHIALQRLSGVNAAEYFTVLPGIKIEVDERDCLVIDVPFVSGKIVTNDLVEVKNHLQFKWLGRIDNIINSGGVKVIPEKIEARINALFVQHHIENKFLIAGMPDNTFGYKVVLLLEGTMPRVSLEKIRAELKEILPPYEMPKEIYENVNFIFTENGKINRSETAQQLGN